VEPADEFIKNPPLDGKLKEEGNLRIITVSTMPRTLGRV
jgi:hypothetical protein